MSIRASDNSNHQVSGRVRLERPLVNVAVDIEGVADFPAKARRRQGVVITVGGGSAGSQDDTCAQLVVACIARRLGDPDAIEAAVEAAFDLEPLGLDSDVYAFHRSYPRVEPLAEGADTPVDLHLKRAFRVGPLPKVISLFERFR